MPRYTRVGLRLTLLALALSACSDAPERAGRAAQAELAPSGWKLIDSVDFNGDGLVDALWNDPGTNRMAVFLLRGTDLLEAGPAIPGPNGAGWAAVTGVDFNLDGMADVPWYSTVSKRAAVWLMRGTHVIEAGPEIPGPRGDGWGIAYAGDFNGDGMGDLLWYNPIRARIAVWLMRGTHLLEAGPELPVPPGRGWTVPTIADFNLDGMGDILWFNTHTQHIAVWLMRGPEVIEQGQEIPGPPGDGWTVPTAVDFNHDGMADVIWNNPTPNRIAVWLMRGTCLLEAGPEIPGPPGDGWSIGSAGDADGDGMADALWQNPTTSQMAVWTMNGTRVLTRGPALPGPL